MSAMNETGRKATLVKYDQFQNEIDVTSQSENAAELLEANDEISPTFNVISSPANSANKEESKDVQAISEDVPKKKVQLPPIKVQEEISDLEIEARKVEAELIDDT